MGGGGSGPGPIGDLESLIARAKEKLRTSEQEGRRNVFLSFAYEDIAYVNLLRGQARNDNLPIEFNDWSVSEPIDSERANYIREKIADRIMQSSVTVVFLSEHSAKSRWVDWEIRESVRQGKHVIGVHPKGAQPPAHPTFHELGLQTVPWPDLPRALNDLK